MQLHTLYGKPKLGVPALNFSLFSMAGNGQNLSDLDPRQLSNVEAGILFLHTLAKSNPGLTWKELIQGNTNLKLGLSLKSLNPMNAVRSIGKNTRKFIDKVGDYAGDAIRLATDKQVMDGVKSYASAYATGGQSLAVEGMLKDLTGGKGSGDPNILQQFTNFLGNIGKDAKGQINSASAGTPIIGGIDNRLLLIGAGGLILTILLLKK